MCLRLCQLPRYGCSGRTCRPIWPRCVTKQSKSLSKLSRTVAARNKIKTLVSRFDEALYFSVTSTSSNLFFNESYRAYWLNYFLILVLNCSRLLTRVLPYIFEEPDWENIFWSSLPAGKGDPPIPLAHSLCSAICVSIILILIEIISHV